MEIHRLREPAFDVNLHLVAAGDEALLVDAGTGLASDAVLASLRSLIPVEHVSTLYLTHRHADHVGGAAALRDATGAAVRMHGSEAAAVREGDASLTLGGFLGVPQAPCPVEDVTEGDVVRVGDVRFEVLLAPGHSPGHTALWDGASGTLLSGDVVFAGGAFGRVDLPGSDPRALVESLDRLAELAPEAVYPGHGPSVLQDAPAAVERSARNARMMLLGEVAR